MLRQWLTPLESTDGPTSLEFDGHLASSTDARLPSPRLIATSKARAPR
jgi:hypothetical protein